MTESTLLTVLIQFAVIIVAARVFGALFRRIGQPAVVGEIFAGLLLGPSVFGHFLPGIWAGIFKPGVNEIFTVISHLGLIFLLFLVGIEFEFKHLKTHGRAALSISLAGILPPFALGWVLGAWMHPRLDAAVDARGFTLFLGTAMSITAMPVLARIMMELNIARTRIGAVTIAAAALDDAVGWILLAAVSALVRAQFDPVATLAMIGETIVFAAVMIFAARPLLLRWVRRISQKDERELSLNTMATLVVILLLSAICTSLIGIFAIFGAFLFGATLSGEERFRKAVKEQLSGFVLVFFLPIFFTCTGLRTDISTLFGGGLWLMALLVSLCAIAGKFGGCALAARMSGFDSREATCIGAMMNTRGLMELVVINVGYELGVIPKSVFCMLVIMALVTTVMTTPLLMRVMRRTELEPYIRASSFGVKGQSETAR